MRNRKNKVLEGKANGQPFKVRGDYTRFTIWSCLVHSDKALMAPEIQKKTGLSYYKVKCWLDVWSTIKRVKKQKVEGRSPTGGVRYSYKIINSNASTDELLSIPKVDVNGKDKPLADNQYIWRSMCNLETFSPNQIVEECLFRYDVELHIDYVVSYIYVLHQSGYLKYLWQEPIRVKFYSLQHQTGLLAPSVLRGKRVFDPNLQVIIN